MIRKQLIALCCLLPPQLAIAEELRLEVRAGFEALRQVYPRGIQPSGLGVVRGLAVVPVAGGAFVAGWNGWLVEPGKDPISAITFDRAGFGYAIVGGGGAPAVGMLQPGSRALRGVARLPPGSYQLSPGPSSGAWIWGRSSSGAWRLWELNPDLKEVALLHKPILGVASAGGSAVVIAIGWNLVRVERGKKPVMLAHLNALIDGLAADDDGTLFASTRAGVFRLDGAGVKTQLVRGAHGPLAMSRGHLYILSRATNEVLQLKPKR